MVAVVALPQTSRLTSSAAAVAAVAAVAAAMRSQLSGPAATTADAAEAVAGLSALGDAAAQAGQPGKQLGVGAVPAVLAAAPWKPAGLKTAQLGCWPAKVLLAGGCPAKNLLLGHVLLAPARALSDQIQLFVGGGAQSSPVKRASAGAAAVASARAAAAPARRTAAVLARAVQALSALALASARAVARVWAAPVQSPRLEPAVSAQAMSAPIFGLWRQHC